MFDTKKETSKTLESAVRLKSDMTKLKKMLGVNDQSPPPSGQSSSGQGERDDSEREHYEEVSCIFPEFDLVMYKPFLLESWHRSQCFKSVVNFLRLY